MLFGSCSLQTFSLTRDTCYVNFGELHFPQCLCPYRLTTCSLKLELNVTDSTTSDNAERAALILITCEYGTGVVAKNGDHRFLRVVRKRSDNYQTLFDFTFEWDIENKSAINGLILKPRRLTAVPPRNTVVLQGSRRTLHVPWDRRKIRKRTNQESSCPEWSCIDGGSCGSGFLSQC